MPRTKVNTKKTNKKIEEGEGIDKQLLLSDLNDICEMLDQYKFQIRTIIEDNYTHLMRQFTTDMLNSKVSDVLKMNSTGSVLFINTTCKQDILNHTKSVKKGNRKVKRSSSLVDEGYLTTESSNSVDRTSTSHQSRLKVQKTGDKSKRITRSHSNPTKNNYTTPADKKMTSNTYGMVTPKCKPNTPQVLLRRPKAGEVALSFQGSPLLTAPVVTDDMANVNIPLTDGTLLSLRAQEGLRLSQIPQFDHVTLNQLDTLSKNISMVLKAAGSFK